MARDCGGVPLHAILLEEVIVYLGAINSVTENAKFTRNVLSVKANIILHKNSNEWPYD